jgi:membrane fusion protein (multidrug efflux system)
MVVVTDVTTKPFEDWGSYSAELRGIEDATLTTPAQGGRVNWLKEVGTRFRIGDTLCEIDGERYEAAFEAAKAQVDVTNGDLERAKVNVEKGWVGHDALDAANLAYQNARVALASARRMLDDAECRAPFDGIITSRNIERFQTVVSGAPTLRVSRIDQLQAIIAIPETEAFSYAPGMKTEFHLLQHPEQVYEGRLASCDLAVDSRSRTVTARIVVRNRDGSLRPGMVGRASVLRHHYDKAIVIPSTALVRLQNGIAAMVVENGIARQRIIRVGATSGDSTMIVGGLSQGDKLIVTGAFQVSDGTRVRY